MSPRIWNTAREYAELVIRLGVLMVATLALATQFNVRGPSMEPTLVQNDRVIVNRLGSVQLGGFSLYGNGRFLFQGPERGDVVIFEPQNYGNDSIVKRVIGLPGDNIDINRNGEVFVNNVREGYGGDYTDSKGYFDYPVMVPAGHYFVMGDNRGQSSDSRDWGFLPAQDIIGEAWAVGWPLSNFVIF